MIDKLEMLERLSTMWKAGTLTDEEFHEEKRRLLAEETGPVAAAEGRSAFREAFDEVQPGRLAMFAGAAAAGVIALVAIAEWGPQSLPFMKPSWESMDTPTLEHEFQRAFLTGGKLFLECSRDGIDESCQAVKPTFADAAAMGDILCTRQPGSRACEQRDSARDMAQSMEMFEKIGAELQARTGDMTSYEHR